MSKIAIAFSIFSLLPGILFGQSVEINQDKIELKNESLIHFPKTHHDFGKIEEFKGQVKVDFEFTNVGEDPLLILDVEASCGCTVPTWPSDSILPGDSSVIQVVYDPTNRPGTFNKTVTVTSNGKQPVSVLSVDGMVMPKPDDLASQYPLKVGGLQFRKNSLQFGNITNEKPITKSIEAFNNSDQIIAFTGNHLGPKHIQVSFEPQAINPGQVGMINVTYDAKLVKLGYNSDNIVLYTYELEDSVKQFNIFATALGHFDPIEKSALASLPKMEVDKSIEDFGNVNVNELLKTEFTIYNNGKQPLVIEAVRPNCDCLMISNEKESVAPGDSTKISVKFQISPTTGTQQKLISVFTNDPTEHVKVLTVKAYVRD
jgi:hypothetical protein